MKILPYYSESDRMIKSGDLINGFNFCNQIFNHKCLAHYKAINETNQIGQFSRCPYGFASLLLVHKKRKAIFTSLDVIGVSNPREVKRRQSKYGSVIALRKEKALQLAQQDIEGYVNTVKLIEEVRIQRLENENLDKRISEIEFFVNSTIHEIRKLNREIKAKAEKSSKLNDESNNDGKLGFYLKDIFASSSLISQRLNAYDLIVNPDLIKQQKQRSIAIYGKFDKVKRILYELAAQKKVEIGLIGECYDRIQSYDFFDILPFIFIENAIKYSPGNRKIQIMFESKTDLLAVRINSIGPLVTNEEIPRIVEREFRGENAQAYCEGSGIGLYVAALICDLHNIHLEITSIAINDQFNGIPLGSFKVALFWDKMK